jgi:hypothetical protein
MKDPNDKLDSLLNSNTHQLLENFDWNRLQSKISQHLNASAAQRPLSPVLFKVAALLLVASSALFLTFKIRTDHKNRITLLNENNAKVSLIEKTPKASVILNLTPDRQPSLVQIQPARKNAKAIVNLSDPQKHLAKCTVEIIDQNGNTKKDSDTPKTAWIIITFSEPPEGTNETDNDETELIYLL